MNNTMLDHALTAAAAEHQVLPLHTPTATGCSCADPNCRSVGKHPRTRNGKDDATDDQDTIRGWWRRWPDANLGVRPGRNTVVLDVDPRAGGATRLARLLDDKRARLLPTLTAHTGGGGLHIWYRCPGPYRGQLCPGVDLKSAAGYLVAPPSLHASGRRYQWTATHPIAPAPPWLVDLIHPAPPPRRNRQAVAAADADRVLSGLVKVVREAPKGARNVKLFWSACRLAEHAAAGRIPLHVGAAALLDAAQQIGLTEQEATKTLNSALRRTQGAAA